MLDSVNGNPELLITSYKTMCCRNNEGSLTELHNKDCSIFPNPIPIRVLETPFWGVTPKNYPNFHWKCRHDFKSCQHKLNLCLQDSKQVKSHQKLDYWTVFNSCCNCSFRIFFLDKMRFLSYNISSDFKIKTCLPIFGVKNLKCEGYYMEFILYPLSFKYKREE